MAAASATGLYHIYGEADSLLYIGVSKHFGVRWQQHAQKQPWWNERRRMTVDFYDTRDEALDAEALAIFTEQPKYNVLHRKQAQRLQKLRGLQPANRLRSCRQQAAPRRLPVFAPVWGTPEYEEMVHGTSPLA